MRLKNYNSKVGILHSGTKGDFLPLIALGIELISRGYDVKMIYISIYPIDFSFYTQRFNFLIESAMPEDFYKRASLQYEAGLMRNQSDMENLTQEMYKRGLDALSNLCQESEIVISCASQTSFPVATYAELYRCFHVMVFLQHMMIPCLHKKTPFVVDASDVLASWKILEDYFNNIMQEPVVGLRQQLGLPALENVYLDTMFSADLSLVAVSNVFCESYSKGWSSLFKVCGHICPPMPTEKHEVLESFMAEGEAPIFFSLGSLEYFIEQPFAIVDVVIKSALKLNKRLVIHLMTSKIDDASLSHSPDILVVRGNLDHKSIFPSCAVVIHHGGAGTTHSACASGCASIVLHGNQDMPFWAKEMQQLGVSLEHIFYADVTEEWLIVQLKAMYEDAAIFTRAEAIKQQMQVEANAVQKTVNYIERDFFAKDLAAF